MDARYGRDGAPTPRPKRVWLVRYTQEKDWQVAGGRVTGATANIYTFFEGGCKHFLFQFDQDSLCFGELLVLSQMENTGFFLVKIYLKVRTTNNNDTCFQKIKRLGSYTSINLRPTQTRNSLRLNGVSAAGRVM